jgi:hypothetical protein
LTEQVDRSAWRGCDRSRPHPWRSCSPSWPRRRRSPAPNGRIASGVLREPTSWTGGPGATPSTESAGTICSAAAPGETRSRAGRGDDRLAVHADNERDAVSCGAGLDIVNAELGDTIAADCEVVSRQLSRDTPVDFQAQHATQVEPHAFAYGSTIVATFQFGRYVRGSAARIGWATSTDGGRTWRSGFLPGFTVFSTPAGPLEVATDPIVACDVEHGVWLIATLGGSAGGAELLVSPLGTV